MSDELKPCPFCRSPARLAGGPMAQESYSVWCSGQARHSMDYGFDREAAIAAWNTRADIHADLRAAADALAGVADHTGRRLSAAMEDPAVPAGLKGSINRLLFAIDAYRAATDSENQKGG